MYVCVHVYQHVMLYDMQLNIASISASVYVVAKIFYCNMHTYLYYTFTHALTHTHIHPQSTHQPTWQQHTHKAKAKPTAAIVIATQ